MTHSTIDDVRASRQSYFAGIEAGKITTWNDLLEVCKSRQKHETTWQALEYVNIPTLHEIEIRFARGPSSRATGLDNLPYEMYRLDPRLFAKIFHPLFAKIACSIREPINWKGGLMGEIFKGNGRADINENYRGVLMSDGVAKCFHGCMRDRLTPFFENACQDTQTGGRKSKATDMASHILRILLHVAKRCKINMAVLFLDATAAFYSVVRQLVMNADLSDASIAHVMKSLNIEPDAMHRLAARIAQPTVFEKVGVPAHLHAIVGECFEDTWFASRDIDNIVCTKKGTRPGDPFGDIVFNFMMSEVLGRVRHRLRANGLMLKLPSSELSSWCDMTQRGMHEMIDVSFVDDVAAVIAADDPEALKNKTAAVAATYEHELESVGIRLNFKPGKSAAVMHFAGPNAKTAFEQLMCDQGAKIQVQKTNGKSFHLQCEMQYKHLGGIIDKDSSMRGEIIARMNGAIGIISPIRNKFLACRKYPLKTRRMVLHSLTNAKGFFNAHTWTPLNVGEQKCLESKMFQICRPLALAETKIDKRADAHISHDCALVAAGSMPACSILSSLRLKYFARIVLHGPETLMRVIMWENMLCPNVSWLSQLKKDLSWLRQNVSGGYEAPSKTSKEGRGRHVIGPTLYDPCAIDEWADFIRSSPKGWHSMVKRAEMRARHQFQVTQDAIKKVNNIHDMLNEHIPITGPQESRDYVCTLCSRAFTTKQKCRAHEASAHGMRIPARALVSGSVCQSCLRDFRSRTRLLDHLHRGTGCFENYDAFFPRLPQEIIQREDAEAAADKKDKKRTGKRKRQECLPMRQMQGPGIRNVAAEAPRSSALSANYGMENHNETAHATMPEVEANLDAVCDIPPHVVSSVSYVLILFAGRRRDHDIAYDLNQMSESEQVSIVPITIDIIYGEKCDLRKDSNVNHWRDKIKSGMVCGIIVAPPCETWSAARIQKDGPPPVRASSTPWGLSGMLHRFYLQVDAANDLLLGSLSLVVTAWQYGLFALLEHPEAHHDPEISSIWRLELVQRICMLPGASTHAVLQGRFGQATPKPTRLLAIRLPTLDSRLEQGASHTCVRGPPLIGKDERGNFRSAKAREYPARLAKAMAMSAIDTVLGKSIIQGVRESERDMSIDSFMNVPEHEQDHHYDYYDNGDENPSKKAKRDTTFDLY